MTKKKKKLAPIGDEQPMLSEAEAAEVLASAPAQIAPKTADNPSGQITEACLDQSALGRLNRVRAKVGLPPVPAPAPVPAVVLPVGKRADKGFVWELDALWTERVERMAAVAGLSAQGYLDSLLRRAWVGLDQRHRGRL